MLVSTAPDVTEIDGGGLGAGAAADTLSSAVDTTACVRVIGMKVSTVSLRPCVRACVVLVCGGRGRLEDDDGTTARSHLSELTQ